MALLDLIFPRARAISAADERHWVEVGGMGGYRTKTRAGVTIDEEIALTYEACFAATRVLAEGVGCVPLPVYERKSESDRTLADLPIADMFKYQINESVSAGVFREGRVANQVNWGNGFAEIERRPGSDEIVALWPIHPSRVSASKDPKYAYLVRGNDGKDMPLYAHEMLHIPGALSEDGMWGRGVVFYGRETLGGGIGIDRASYSNLGSGGQPKGIIIAPGLNDRTKRAEYRKEWEQVHGNPEVNVPTIAILNPGSQYIPLGAISNEQNQLIQTRVVNKANVATLYGIPAYKIGAEGKETAGTIEQKAIEFVVYSLLPWAKKWEEQCGFKLLTREQRRQFYFEHNFTALLRGDQASRYNAYRVAFSIGVMSINEIRRLENLPGIGEAGDQYFVPANMTTADRALSGDFGNGGAIGSDTTGSPADNPMDRKAEEWMKAVTTKAQREEASKQLKAIEHALPERKFDHVAVARQALHDVLGNMYTKEVNAASRAAKDKGKDFEAWLNQFYAEHESLLVERLRTACMTLDIAGVARWADRTDLAAWLCARSKETLRSSYNTDTPDTFARKLAVWPTDRAASVAEEILGERV